MIKIELLEDRELKDYLPLLDPAVEEVILDGGRLEAHSFALGARRDGRPVGLLTGLQSDTVMEVLELQCSREELLPAGGRLLIALRRLAELRGGELLLWSYSVEEEALSGYEQLLTSLGWAKPECRRTILEVDTRARDLSQRLTAHQVSGQVVPLMEVPICQQLDFLQAHQEEENGDFTRYSPLISDLSLAYVEDGAMLGYLAVVRGREAPELAGSYLPKDKAALGALLAGAARSYERQEYRRLFIRVGDQLGMKLCTTLFRDKIISTQLQMDTELQLVKEAGA